MSTADLDKMDRRWREERVEEPSSHRETQQQTQQQQRSASMDSEATKVPGYGAPAQIQERANDGSSTGTGPVSWLKKKASLAK